MNEEQENSQASDAEYSMEIDGRTYYGYAFFKQVGETLQQKIERMIQRDILSGALNTT